MNNKTNTELLPCPFCGHEASMTQHESAGGDGRMIWIVGCNSEDCEVSFQGHARKCDAAKDWNARTIDPQLLELCENDEEREILATKNRDGLFTRFLITRAKGDAWPKTPCSKCGHRFHEKECHTSLVSSRGSVACDCAGYDHAAAELREKVERLPEERDRCLELVSICDKFWGMHEGDHGDQWYITWNGTEWKFDSDLGDFRDVTIEKPTDAIPLIRQYGKADTEPADNIGEGV